jgi:hypothetical protein
VAKKEVLVCDVCESDEDVEDFTVASGDGELLVDLCPKHRQPLVELRRHGRWNRRADGPPARSASTRSSDTGASPLSDVMLVRFV